MICNNCNQHITCKTQNDINKEFICKNCNYYFKINNGIIKTFSKIYNDIDSFSIYSYNYDTPYTNIYYKGYVPIKYNEYIVPKIINDVVEFKEFLVKIKTIILLS